MMLPVILVEVAALLLACWLLAYWRLTRHLRDLQRVGAHMDAPGAPRSPGRRAVCALSAQDALDLLLVTRDVLNHAEHGSALHCAADRVRMVGETAATDLRLHPDLWQGRAER